MNRTKVSEAPRSFVHTMARSNLNVVSSYSSVSQTPLLGSEAIRESADHEQLARANSPSLELTMLLEMGFRRELCLHALSQCEGSVHEAAEFIVMNQEHMDREPTLTEQPRSP